MTETKRPTSRIGARRRTRTRRLAAAVVIAALTAPTVGMAPSGAAPTEIEGSSPTFVRAWGTTGAGNGQFSSPQRVAVDSGGNVYVADANNDRIQKFTADGTFVTAWGTEGTANGQFDNPTDVAVGDADDILVVDSGNARIQRFDAGGAFISAWGTGGTGNGQFNNPVGVGTDADGNVYVADGGNARVQKFTASGTFLTAFGGPGSGNGQFGLPSDVAVSTDGDVYVTDTPNARVQKFTTAGTFVSTLGTAGTGNGQFDTPTGIAVDAAGNLFVVETLNARVQKFTSSGTFVAKWGTSGAGNGQFSFPTGIAIAADGGSYVADNGNDRIQQFGPGAPAAPANDKFRNAEVLTGASGSVSRTNVGATAQTGEPRHGGPAATHSVWFTWTPPVSGAAVVDTCGSGFGTRLVLYGGASLDRLTRMTTKSDPCGAQSALTTARLVAGRPIRIAVDTVDGTTGPVELHWWAGTVQRPDLMVRQTGGPTFVGADAYQAYNSDDPLRQVLRVASTANTATFEVQLQNDSTGPSTSFSVWRRITDGTDVTTRIFDGTTDVTNLLISRTGYQVARLGAGATHSFTVQTTYDSPTSRACLAGPRPPGRCRSSVEIYAIGRRSNGRSDIVKLTSSVTGP